MDTRFTRPDPVAEPFARPVGKAATARHAATIDAKKLSTFRAEAALAGATLLDAEDDYGLTVFVLTRGHITRRFTDLSHLEDFLYGEGLSE